MGLMYPFIYFVNGIFVVYWLLRKSKFFLISGVSMLLGIYHFKTIYQFRSADKDLANTEQAIKVMSFNVRLFDLYNWSSNKHTRNQILEFIKREKPDIIAIQEFYADDENEFINIDSLKQALGLNVLDAEYTLTLRKKHHWGIATFTRFKLVGSGHVNFRLKSNNVCIYSDLLIGKDTVRLYNMHLQSIHLLKEDYKFIDDLGKDSITVNELEGSTNIARRLKRAFVKRAEQCDSVARSIKQSPYPVIVCGDFNDTPASYTYQTVSNGLKDAFVEAGKGFGKTYIGIFPSYRIDYIFHDKSYEAYNYITHTEKLSDHYAISCLLKKK